MTPSEAASVTEQPPFKARLRDWLQLCRAPNLFTAVADPLTGALVCGAGWRDTGRILIVMFASACFYAGGIMLNDWHDYKRDLVERPTRPLPAKRISRLKAFLVSMSLLALGQLLASAPAPTAGGIGLLLVATILAYDVWLKEIPIAPGLMGLCRGLNLLLGMSIVPAGDGTPPRFYLCLLAGFYVMGITVFARREAGLARKDQLVLGAGIVGVALLMLAVMQPLFPEREISSMGLIWLGLLAAALGFRMIQAILTPSPVRIQSGVKLGVLGIILLDAAIVGSFCGLPLSLLVVVLLVPAGWLGKWLYTT